MSGNVVNNLSFDTVLIFQGPILIFQGKARMRYRNNIGGDDCSSSKQVPTRSSGQLNRKKTTTALLSCMQHKNPFHYVNN